MSPLCAARPARIHPIHTPLDAATTTGIVGRAPAGGVNWFDTAEMYGGAVVVIRSCAWRRHAEDSVGSALLGHCATGSNRFDSLEEASTGEIPRQHP